jgi:hypothetical protein
MSYGVAGFDSAAALLMATANATWGKGFPAMGHPPALRPLVRASEALPEGPRRAAYAAATGFEAIPQKRIGDVSADDIAGWVADLYPERRFPAAIVGSSSGALVHLAAALGVPWLPQTIMIGVRRTGGGIDDPRGDLEQARESGEALVAANPDIPLHQMHDPSQDRLSLRYITYFRIKYRRLSAAYRRFLTERLEPGSTILVSECRKRWPATRVGDRYFFQFGAVGGMDPEEYFTGSPRVAEYLARYGVDMERWDPPRPDCEVPEAEWGFEAALMDDIEAFARDNGHRVLRLAFDDAEYASPLVADLYRDWYRRRGIPENRLVVESFALVEPRLMLETGSVPFWLTFNCRPSLDWLRKYLSGAERYDQIRMMIFPHGTESVGLPSIDEWREVMTEASGDAAFLGVNEKAYPNHFGELARYDSELEALEGRHPLPEPMPLEDFERFLAKAESRYAVRLAA